VLWIRCRFNPSVGVLVITFRLLGHLLSLPCRWSFVTASSREAFASYYLESVCRSHLGFTPRLIGVTLSPQWVYVVVPCWRLPVLYCCLVEVHTIILSGGLL